MLLNSCFCFASREQIRLVENGLKSTVHDNIPVKLLKDASDVVAPFLVKIFNSLRHGIFPDELKTYSCRITLIHKSGDKKNAAITGQFLFSRL